jgi:hypothetical protein
MLDRIKMASPVLLSVMVSGGLVVPTFCGPKVRLAGERLTTGTATPVPAKLTVCGLPLALSVMVSVALRAPDAVGVNVTWIVQPDPAATLLLQAFVWEKSAEFVPVRPRLVMLSAVFPTLERITFCAKLVEPTFC